MVKLKGLFYRKLKNLVSPPKKEEEKLLFRISKPLHVIELPTLEDPRKLNVTYPLIEPFAYAHIHWDDELKNLVYEVLEPKLTEKEENYLEEIASAIGDLR